MKDHAIEGMIQLQKERDDWREEAWRCYQATGADPDGADARHLNPGEALAEVKALRLQAEVSYNEGVEDALRIMETAAQKEKS